MSRVVRQVLRKWFVVLWEGVGKVEAPPPEPLLFRQGGIITSHWVIEGKRKPPVPNGRRSR